MEILYGRTGAVAVIGAGPAGLMAAERLAEAGLSVDVYDSMPTAGRKFLMAGKGGLNITHSEPIDAFRRRYPAGAAALSPFLDAFGPRAIEEWIHGLGITTFVGSSGRVFPREMKAAPLLRSWLRRLRGQGVTLYMRHRWEGWSSGGALRFTAPSGPVFVKPTATVLALGGASWPQLGSVGTWEAILASRGIGIAPLKPSNCGFDADWSAHFSEKFAGAPVKHAAIGGRKGEFIVTATGVEGGLVYSAARALREEIEATGQSVMKVDLRPDRTEAQLAVALSRPRGRASFASYLRKGAGIEGVKAGLVRELVSEKDREDPRLLAAAIKALPIRLRAPRPLSEAISTAGGVRFDEVNDSLMLRKMPGIFVAGEMLDWDAPTGGYLLTACLATGRAAGEGARRWVAGV